MKGKTDSIVDWGGTGYSNHPAHRKNHIGSSMLRIYYEVQYDIQHLLVIASVLNKLVYTIPVVL
jgi:hypothetical protein